MGTLVNQRPTALFMASYDSSIDGNWGNGSMTATVLAGSPTATGGYLVLNAANARLYYSATSNFPSDNTGAVRFIVRPDYSGSPATQQDFFNVSNGITSVDRITCFHATSGNITLIVYNSSGSALFTLTSAWSPVSGTDYEFEINFDGSTGLTQLFIDGNIILTNSSTWTRSNGATLINIGRSAGTLTFGIKWLIIFDSVQHTTAYTPTYTQPPITLYNTDNPTLTVATGLVGAFTGFETTTSVSGSDAIKYVLNVGGVDKYWNGTTWTTSSGYNQSNTVSEINSNIDELDVTLETVKPKVYFHSDTGSTTPTITSMTITYDVVNESATTPTMCYLEGYLYDHNTPITSTPVYVRCTGVAVEEIFVSNDWQTFDTTDTSGYFSGRIWGGATYDFRINNKQYTVSIPNQSIIGWWDLVG